MAAVVIFSFASCSPVDHEEIPAPISELSLEQTLAEPNPATNWEPSLALNVEHSTIILSEERNAFALIKYSCEEPATFNLVIYARRPYEARTLFSRKAHEPGDYEVRWDGKDDFGIPVQSGYYFLKATDSDTGEVLFDSSRTAWGTRVSYEEVRFEGDGRFEYHLPENALVRVGVSSESSGAYYRTILDWAARPKGHQYENWDGYDKNGRVALIQRPGLAIHVGAYKLPDTTIIVASSPTEAIPVVVEDSEFVVPPIGLDEVVEFARQEEDAARTPEFRLHVQNESKEDIELQNAQLTDPVKIHVDLDPVTKKVLQEQGYAVNLYLDDKLAKGMEHADSTFSYTLDPANFAPGKHLLNVNVVSDEGGHVGAELREFIVPTTLTKNPRLTEAASLRTASATSSKPPTLLAGIHIEKDGQSLNLGSGEFLVALLSTTCDHCMGWVPRLNEIAADQNLPTLVGLMWGDSTTLADFRAITSPSFPTTLISAEIFFPLIGSSPPRLIHSLSGKPIRHWDDELPGLKSLMAEINRNEGKLVRISSE